MQLNSNAEKLISNALEAGRRILLGPEAEQICAAVGIPVIENKMATNLDQAYQFAQEIGYPVALKIVSPDVPHKSEVGGVAVGVGSKEQLQFAYNGIMQNVKQKRPSARVAGLEIQKSIPPCVELIFGASTDPILGKVVSLGLGGVFVELVKDISFRLPPISNWDARQMIQQLKYHQVFDGYRNLAPVDEAVVVGNLLKFSALIEQPLIQEVDLNPVMASGRNIFVADARIILAGSKGDSSASKGR